MSDGHTWELSDRTAKTRFLYLGFIMFLAILGPVVNSIDGSINATLLALDSFSTEVAWVSTGLLLVFLASNLGISKNLRTRKASWLELVIAIVFFAATTFIGEVSGYLPGSGLFRCGFITVMFAGLRMGLRVSVPAAALAFALHLLIMDPFTDQSNIPYLLVFTAAVAGGAVGDFGKDPKLKYLVPAAVFITHALCDPKSMSSFFLTDYESLYYVSLASTVLVGTYGLVMMDLFDRINNEHERIKSSDRDLNLAHEIQMAAVPTSFPTTHSIDIHAVMVPAIEVGGDFYDCFTIGRNLTVFVVADVSDKGLPASLLMMRMLGSVKAAAILKPVPGEILTAINRDLCRNNPTDQFLTAWIGIYDSDTGVLQYANAGHTPPYIRRNGGNFEKLECRKGTVVGFSESIRYRNSETSMGDGDALFIYTDGVNEAFNAAGEEFGHVRLKKALDAADNDAACIIEDVRSAVKSFTGTNPASDDITMVSFVTHRSGYRSLTVPGKAEQLDAVNGFIEDVLSEAGCPMKEILKTEIVAEEIFVNICDHAYEDMDGEVTTYCSYCNGEIKLTFSDQAKFFNPISKEDVEIDEDVGNWPIGGFGIHMVKKLVTYMDYKYFAGRNIFTIWKRTGEFREEEVSEERISCTSYHVLDN